MADESMKRITCSNASETLMKALEHVDDMDDVVVLYYAKDGCKGSFFASEGLKEDSLLWLIEKFKKWLLGDR